jgi:hypothetical protein
MKFLHIPLVIGIISFGSLHVDHSNRMNIMYGSLHLCKDVHTYFHVDLGMNEKYSINLKILFFNVHFTDNQSQYLRNNFINTFCNSLHF